MRRHKALALLSGGLDSSLAAKLVLEQGIELIGVKFTSPLCTCDQKGRCYAKDIARQLGIPFKMVAKGADYLKVIRRPRFGYGSGMNPCVDCRIYMFRKAWQIAQELGAEFIVTGEVLNQRPMSQYFGALRLIEREAGLEGKILRPLSAAYLPPTEPERKGWVDRSKFPAIKGRSRRPQLALSQKMGIDEHACAAGGCLLTSKEFARKLGDLFAHKTHVTWSDVALLKVGRHFRFGRNKIIVGRNEGENHILRARKQRTDYLFEVLDCGSPVTLLQGHKTREAIIMAARLTARYSDAGGPYVRVHYGKNRPVRGILVEPARQEEIERLMIVREHWPDVQSNEPLLTGPSTDKMPAVIATATTGR